MIDIEIGDLSEACYNMRNITSRGFDICEFRSKVEHGADCCNRIGICKNSLLIILLYRYIRLFPCLYESFFAASIPSLPVLRIGGFYS